MGRRRASKPLRKPCQGCTPALKREMARWTNHQRREKKKNKTKTVLLEVAMARREPRKMEKAAAENLPLHSCSKGCK
jgi:hypothetical protein